jgi:hypothetical protein
VHYEGLHESLARTKCRPHTGGGWSALSCVFCTIAFAVSGTVDLTSKSIITNTLSLLVVQLVIFLSRKLSVN